MTEEELIAGLQNESLRERHFRVLVEQYQERLYWHIRRFVLYHEDANDVIQNTFIKAWNGIGNFRADSKLYTWLYRIATNESINYLNKRKQVRADNVDDEAAVAHVSQLQADPYFDGDEAERRLYEAMETLPEKQRAVFQLRYFEEMPYEEMAEITGTSTGALKASYHHAVKKIEHYLKSRDDV